MKNKNGKYIVFCRSVEHIDEMQELFPEWLKGVNKNIHTYITLAERSDKDIQIQTFRNDDSDTIKLLFTVDRLNEGLHVKGIDGVIMLRKTISPIIYLQQIGRALVAGWEVASDLRYG